MFGAIEYISRYIGAGDKMIWRILMPRRVAQRKLLLSNCNVSSYSLGGHVENKMNGSGMGSGSIHE